MLASYKISNYSECADRIIIGDSVTTPRESFESNEMFRPVSDYGLAKGHRRYWITIPSDNHQELFAPRLSGLDSFASGLEQADVTGEPDRDGRQQNRQDDQVHCPVNPVAALECVSARSQVRNRASAWQHLAERLQNDRLSDRIGCRPLLFGHRV